MFPRAHQRPPGFYGLHECDFEIAYAVRQGFPAQWFIPLPNSALSTGRSPSRAGRVAAPQCAELSPDIERLPHRPRPAHLPGCRARHGGRARRARCSGPDEHFRPDSWWRSREGQKTAFFEWSKTFATALGM